MSRILNYLISFVFVPGLILTSTANAADSTLVGFWKFEEADGTLFDQSDNHNDGMLFNGVLYQQAGQDGYALGFDGTDDYIVVGTTGRPTDTFSFGGWFKTPATHEIDPQETAGYGGVNNQRYAFDPQHGGDSNAGAGLSIGTNGITVYEHGSDYMPATAVYETELGDEWNHVMIVYNDKQPTIYLNGQAVHTGFSSPRAIVYSPIQFGGMAYGYFEGLMDEVRIYDRALSPAEIRKLAARPKAWSPDPPSGAMYSDIWVTLSWSPGGFAVSHDVYFDDNFEDVDAGTGDAFRGNQTSPYYVVGFPGYPFADGLVPGTTYYWRIDEVNDLHPDSPWRGNVWNFTVPPKKAYNPVPSDNAKYIDMNVTLTWTPGFGAKMHVVYFGEDFDTVSNASGSVPGGLTTYTPGELELGKVYYWRIDELDGVNTYKGDVWSFKTMPVISVTDPNLMGWWKFDEGAGATAVDWSGHGNHGEIHGGTEWIDGYDGGALRLKGQDGYVNLPIGAVIASMDSTTIATWVNFSNAGGAWQRIFDFGSGTPTYLFLCPRIGSTGVMHLAIQAGGQGHSEVNAPETLPTGWHHVAAVIKSGSMELYLDGVVIGTGSATTVPSDLGNTSSNWLGRSQFVADGYFNGSLDDFRIYDYTLSADEIVMTMRGDPLLAWNAKPADGTIPDTREALPLSWSAGEKASQHDVYFGTDADAVDDAETSTPEIYRGRQAGTSYTPPEGVEWDGGPYFWRIDEFNTDGTINRGRIWSFTVADFILVDDFESYDAGENQIWYSWHDGLGYGAPGTDPYFAGNGTGAAVGDETTGLYMEETIVHSGGRSLPFYYDNNKQGYAKYSETEMTLTSPCDWTARCGGIVAVVQRLPGVRR